MKKSIPDKKSEAVVTPFKQVRLIDIAAAAGVSRTVAGRVINGGNGNSRVGEETARRIRKIAKQMQYRPNPAARQLRGKRTQTFGVLVASAGDPLRSFLVQHLDMEAAKIGCHTIIGNTIGWEGPNHFGYYIEEFARRGVDGVLCAVHDWHVGDRAALLEAHPNTVFYEDPGIEGARFIEVDRSEAARLAVKHLAERGCQRIGLALAGITKSSSLARKEGYAEELDNQGLPLDESLVFNSEPFGSLHAVHNEKKLTWEYPVNIVDRSIDALIDDAKADAIIAHDDFWAAALIKRLRARGLSVPGDIAVVGYLNHYLADWTDPPLTTIDLQHELAAKEMVKMVEQLVRGESPSQEIGPLKGRGEKGKGKTMISPRLIVRESA